MYVWYTYMYVQVEYPTHTEAKDVCLLYHDPLNLELC